MLPAMFHWYWVSSDSHWVIAMGVVLVAVCALIARLRGPMLCGTLLGVLLGWLWVALDEEEGSFFVPLVSGFLIGFQWRMYFEPAGLPGDPAARRLALLLPVVAMILAVISVGLFAHNDVEAFEWVAGATLLAGAAAVPIYQDGLAPRARRYLLGACLFLLAVGFVSVFLHKYDLELRAVFVMACVLIFLTVPALHFWWMYHYEP